jgi:hypothetical protein
MVGEVLSPHRVEATKATIFTGPVNRQVTEAGNNQMSKRSCEAWNLEEEKQHGDISTLGKCLCCEHYGRPCLQREESLMTNEARQRYYADMSRRKDVPVPEQVRGRIIQERHSDQITNIDDYHSHRVSIEGEWEIQEAKWQDKTRKEEVRDVDRR